MEGVENKIMVKKVFQNDLAKQYDNRSDTELIDLIASGISTNTIKIETAKAILNRRTKRVLQYLTEIIQKNTIATEKYNKTLIALTLGIFVLTVGMVYATVVILDYAKIQAGPAIEQQAKNNKNALIYCKQAPEGEWPNIHGEMISCSKVLEMLDK